MTDSDKCPVCGAERIGSGGFPHATKYACGAITTSSGHAIRNGKCSKAHEIAIERGIEMATQKRRLKIAENLLRADHKEIERLKEEIKQFERELKAAYPSEPYEGPEEKPDLKEIKIGQLRGALEEVREACVGVDEIDVPFPNPETVRKIYAIVVEVVPENPSPEQGEEPLCIDHATEYDYGYATGISKDQCPKCKEKE